MTARYLAVKALVWQEQDGYANLVPVSYTHLDVYKRQILVIEVEGAGNIKRLYPGATTIFVLPPDMQELEHRLRCRGTETEEVIQKRLKRAETEIARSADYDEHVVNDVVQDCADRIYGIIRHRRMQED